MSSWSRRYFEKSVNVRISMMAHPAEAASHGTMRKDSHARWGQGWLDCPAYLAPDAGAERAPLPSAERWLLRLCCARLCAAWRLEQALHVICDACKTACQAKHLHRPSSPPATCVYNIVIWACSGCTALQYGPPLLCLIAHSCTCIQQ